MGQRSKVTSAALGFFGDVQQGARVQKMACLVIAELFVCFGGIPQVVIFLGCNVLPKNEGTLPNLFWCG